MDAVAKVHFVETTRPQDPRRWSHGDSVVSKFLFKPEGFLH